MPDPTLQLPMPRRDAHRNELWLDEQIWGHRLWDSQSPWLLFLEFLNVAEACHREGQLLKEQQDDHGNPLPLRYRPYQRIFLRNILFNNEALFQMVERYPDNATAWSRWLTWMEERAITVSPRSFAYLQKRFPSFHQFAALVGMLRNSSVESESNRRWGSRFVFPFGPHALYEDLNIKADNTVSREYINFGRTGELLYLMLCRSSHAPALRSHLAAAIAGKNSWNALLALFQPDDADEERQKRGEDSYLPYRAHPTFDRLAEDWLRIFLLELPGFDAFPYLVTLGTLHVALYQLTLAADWCGEARPVSFVCEIVAPKKTLVREVATLSYQENSLLSTRAIDTCIQGIEDSEEWRRSAAESGPFVKCRAILERRVHWPRESEDYQGPSDPDALLAELRRTARSRHRQHVANVHRNYGRDAGLISRRGTNRLRYAPSDTLLKTLILANVRQPVEYKEFLALLFQRYGLVFGDEEAKRVLQGDEFEQGAFKANAVRLEQRLASLGMLRRLSDACAYVLNPFCETRS